MCENVVPLLIAVNELILDLTSLSVAYLLQCTASKWTYEYLQWSWCVVFGIL